MNNKKTMIVGILIGILVSLIGVGIYLFIIGSNSTLQHESKSNEDGNSSTNNFVVESLKQGNSIFSYTQNIISNDIEKLNLEQGEYINIYLTGKDISDKEIVLTNGIVAYDYENSSKSVTFLASESFNFELKCIEFISEIDDYKVIVERTENKSNINPELGSGMKEFLSDKCSTVEDVKVEIGEDVNVN